MNYPKKITRGLRNNNPLNIRIGNDWVGEVSHPTDKDFEQFEKMSYGVRAAFIILHNYIVRHKLTTVPEIIHRWAPNNENNTKKYVETVLNRMNFEPQQEISWWNKDVMCNLFQAMCYVENGCVIDDCVVKEGYDLAVGQWKPI